MMTVIMMMNTVVKMIRMLFTVDVDDHDGDDDMVMMIILMVF